MIVQIRKILFYGVASDLQTFVTRAQDAGFIEFLPPTDHSFETNSHILQEITQALKILKKQPVLPEYDRYLSKEELFEKAQEVVHLYQKQERLEEDIRLLDAEIVKIKPLGSFSLDDAYYIQEQSGYFIQYFCRPSLIEEPIDPELIPVGTEYNLDYFISITQHKQHFANMIEIKVEKSLLDCYDQKDKIEQLLKATEKKLKSYACYIHAMEFALGEYQDEDALKSTYKMASFPLGVNFFTIMAYIPKNKEPHIPKILKGLNIQADIIKPEDSEVLPTCFYNKGFSKSGEDLVKIYDIPSSSDKDPSAWVLWTFALFFAMIVSDAGYGFIYLACGFLLSYFKKNPPPSLKRTIKLIKLLGFSCIVWGAMTGSWLGISLSPDNFLKKFTAIEYLALKKADYHVKTQDETLKDLEKKYSLPSTTSVKQLIDFQTKDGKNPIYDGFFKNILLELSLVVGLLHVSMSLVRYMLRNYANIGWLLFAFGGYLYFPSYLHTASLVQFFNIASLETSAALGYQLIIGGISVAMFFALLQNRLKGLGEIANLIQVFADILSYLRLYALALASSIMAETFNHMGMSLGLFFGFIVILAGHGINFILGTMGGVIHGLRLNFIEWYHYSFEGGGKLFKPLKRFTLKN